MTYPAFHRLGLDGESSFSGGGDGCVDEALSYEEIENEWRSIDSQTGNRPRLIAPIRFVNATFTSNSTLKTIEGSGSSRISGDNGGVMQSGRGVYEEVLRGIKEEKEVPGTNGRAGRQEQEEEDEIMFVMEVKKDVKVKKRRQWLDQDGDVEIMEISDNEANEANDDDDDDDDIQYISTTIFSEKISPSSTSSHTLVPKDQSHHTSIAELISTNPDVKMTTQYGLSSSNIGYKMLQGLGWEEGKGIGKDGEGRKVPIRAFVREGRGGVGEKKGRYIDKHVEERTNWKQEKGGRGSKKPKVKGRDERMDVQSLKLLREFRQSME